MRPSDEAPAPQRRSCPACLHHSPRRARPCRLGPQAAVCCAAAVRPAPWSVRASPSCAAPHPASRRQRTPPTLTLASVRRQKGRAGRTPQSRLVPASMAAPSARQVASLAPCKPPRLPLLRGLRGTFGPAAGAESRDGVCPRVNPTPGSWWSVGRRAETVCSLDGVRPSAGRSSLLEGVIAPRRKYRRWSPD